MNGTEKREEINKRKHKEVKTNKNNQIQHIIQFIIIIMQKIYFTFIHSFISFHFILITKKIKIIKNKWSLHDQKYNYIE